jgi:uncharacterized protein YndB with AHSA1/START domain
MQKHHLSTYSTIIHAPVETVWDALTNPSIIKQYFFGTNLVTDWKPGNPLSFHGEWEGKAYEDKGTVLEFIPNKSLSYSYLSSWSNMPDLPENYLHITYKVQPVQEGTELTITQTNYDEERAKHSEGNWAMVIDGLRKIVEQ